MITRQRRKSPLRKLWGPLAATAFLGYFAFHAFSGSFGLNALERLETEAARLEVELDRLSVQRKTLERDVASMRPESLEADVVDLRARTALNLIRADEIVIVGDGAVPSGR